MCSIVENAHMQSKIYKQIKKKKLSSLNQFLIHTAQLGLGSGLRLDFLKEYSGFFTTGLISKHSVIKMLEAADFESVHQLFRSLGVITDRICKYELSRDVVQLFIGYI